MNNEDLSCECGNKYFFIYDFQTGEIICACCGLVVAEEYWRVNRFERTDY